MSNAIGGFLIAILKIYKICISPLMTPACRFIPTCSEYSQAAIEKYGPFRGLILSLKRIFRCHPLYRGGYDPLP